MDGSHGLVSHIRLGRERWSVEPSPCSQTITTPLLDRKSTRLNSSHGYISYAVFCLKKKIHIRISLAAPSLGTSPTLNNLSCPIRESKFDLLLINDIAVRVETRYLRNAVSRVLDLQA